MTAKLPRIVVPVDSHDPRAWPTALAAAEKLAQSGTPQEIVLLTHTKGQLEHTSLTAALGQKTAKGLAGGKSFTLESGARLRAETLQTLRSSPRGAVIIACYGEDKMMTTIDGFAGLNGVVVVPDYADSIPQWIERWNPAVLGQRAKPAATLISDPKVEGAMKSLTMLINLSHGVLNPRDKKAADDILRILRAKGHSTDTTKLKSWAIQNGWEPQAAAELAALAEKIFALKAKPNLAGIHDPDGRYDRWGS